MREQYRKQPVEHRLRLYRRWLSVLCGKLGGALGNSAARVVAVGNGYKKPLLCSCECNIQKSHLLAYALAAVHAGYRIAWERIVKLTRFEVLYLEADAEVKVYLHTVHAVHEVEFSRSSAEEDERIFKSL